MRDQGVTLGQLGTLAMLEGKLDEALDDVTAPRWRCSSNSASRPWRRSSGINSAWSIEEAQQWDEAERHYREAARIQEETTATSPARLQTWNQLAVVSQDAGKPEAAESWYRKAIEADRKHRKSERAGPST